VAVVREAREETGFGVEPGEFVGVWTDTYGLGPDSQTTLNLFWEARVIGGELGAADDVAELGWFPPASLPSRDEIAFDAVALALEVWRSGIGPERPKGRHCRPFRQGGGLEKPLDGEAEGALDRALRLCADDGRRRLAVLEQDHGRNRLHAIPLL
jgi:hypothetical protein